MWRSKNYTKGAVNKLKNMRHMIFFDTETVGLASHSQIVQFSADLYGIQKNPFSLCLEDSVNVFICPDKPMPEKLEKRAGLSNEFLKAYPRESEVFPVIREFMSKAPLVAGYNVKFDIDKLEGLYERNGILFSRPEEIDILEMARDLVPIEESGGDYSLSNISNRLNCAEGLVFHTANDDATASRRVFILLLGRYAKECRVLKRNGEKVRFSRCYYWENKYQKSMKRIVVETSGGNFFYDTVKKNWDTNKGSILTVDDTDMEDLEWQCLCRYRVSSMDELCLKLKR